MRQPFRGGISLRVFALLTFFVAALSSFGQTSVPIGFPKPFPPISKDQNPGFVMGVQESDPTMFNSDVTGATTINPVANSHDAFGVVHARGREYVQATDSTSAEFSTGVYLQPLFGLSDDLRTLHHERPTNAVLQAGPFFVQLNEVDAGLLVSDNVNLTSKNAEWGAIAELRMRLSAILQISPTWRLVVSGSIIYLPFENEFGVEGFGVRDGLGFIADEKFEPVTRMQLVYNSRWGHWDVQAVDHFRVRYVTINGDYNAFTRGMIQPEGVHAEDTAGRYVFGNGTTIPEQNIDRRQDDFVDVRTFLQLENLIAGTATRLLPTETRALFGASHSDFWYHGSWDNGTNTVGATNGLGFSATSVDRVFAAFRNERESMRFKPYLFYDAYRYNYDPDWTHQLGVGFSGPITENMFFRAEGGYTWGSPLLEDTYFYRFHLLHDIGPYTRQFLEYSRDVTEPVREIRDTYLYAIHQILGPELWGRFFFERSLFQPEQLGVFASTEDRAGARILWTPVPNHTYIIGGSYAKSQFDNSTSDRETTWEARAEIRYRYRPDVVFSLLYRYLNIDTRQSLAEFDTAENLWVLSVRKYF